MVPSSTCSSWQSPRVFTRSIFPLPISPSYHVNFEYLNRATTRLTMASPRHPMMTWRAPTPSLVGFNFLIVFAVVGGFRWGDVHGGASGERARSESLVRFGQRHTLSVHHLCAGNGRRNELRLHDNVHWTRRLWIRDLLSVSMDVSEARLVLLHESKAMMMSMWVNWSIRCSSSTTWAATFSCDRRSLNVRKKATEQSVWMVARWLASIAHVRRVCGKGSSARFPSATTAARPSPTMLHTASVHPLSVGFIAKMVQLSLCLSSSLTLKPSGFCPIVNQNAGMFDTEYRSLIFVVQRTNSIQGHFDGISSQIQAYKAMMKVRQYALVMFSESGMFELMTQ